MYECKQCEKKFDNYTSLSRHMGLTHKSDTIQFYVDYHLNGVWPVCKCGCGTKVKWSWQLKSFRDYNAGHQSRVHNNWGNNPKAIEASAETRRRQYVSGERVQWNKGLTKEDNESVRLNGELRSKAYTPVVKNEYADRMRQNRMDGTIPTLRGEDHPNWKGGTSAISAMIYSDSKLYKGWKRPILVRDGFRCTECGSGVNLHVHHDKEMLCEIIKEHVGNGIDTTNFNLKRTIADAVVDYHINNHVPGITLCSKCHEEKHPSLNFQ